MDPYLEQHWGDVHPRLCTYCCDQMQEQLGDTNLIARMGERVIVERPLNKPRGIYPDVRIVERGFGGSHAGTALLDAPLAKPYLIYFGEEETQTFIEIIEADSAQLITVVEFLSPSNKFAGAGREQYERKQVELDAAKVSLVEIDLLRAGPRAFMLPQIQFPPDVNPEYAASVFRAYVSLRYELYPMPMREKLPAIAVPLRKDEPDLILNLQPLIDQAYRNGRYDRTDYTKPLYPTSCRRRCKLGLGIAERCRSGLTNQPVLLIPYVSYFDKSTGRPPLLERQAKEFIHELKIETVDSPTHAATFINSPSTPTRFIIFSIPLAAIGLPNKYPCSVPHPSSTR